MELKYKDKVRVKSGFYEGVEGEVQKKFTNDYISKMNMYRVDIINTNDFVDMPISNLEKI